MGKYSKKLLNRIQEHNVKKILNETGDIAVIQKELIKNGLGDFIPSVEDNCKHELIFKESLPRNSKWFCRYCFTEIDNKIPKLQIDKNLLCSECGFLAKNQDDFDRHKTRQFHLNNSIPLITVQQEGNPQ